MFRAYVARVQTENFDFVVIVGETGCGKSSRVPVMLLKAPPPDGSFRTVRLWISQPRRIAAKALVERVRSCEPELRDKFALRMGHGWKEYVSKKTQACFVTTGYLVRLLANHPERFDECTHLIIDEVHERSVDTDVLCLLCRRLLETNTRIRLVLMSATLATKMYIDYFEVANEPIYVGTRRFPITEYFVEDLVQFKLPKKAMAAAQAIGKEIETKKCIGPPTAVGMSNRVDLAASLATVVGKPGTSVLIFVPGMGEILSITEAIEKLERNDTKKYNCFPIHSDVPFEEQMGAFDEPADDEVKVIIATNAAESSVTLPSVDHVICLGLCRQITYNQSSHRQILLPAWISKASATQRAGRTGRVRPGSVYRLSSRRAFDSYMDEFEPGEMSRIPLDSVILMLKRMLHEEIEPIFLECLEPPPLGTISRSFENLHRWGFITEPSDDGDITSLGEFASSLGIDLSLGSFVGLGIQFGVAAEAIEMAAMMSLPKTPFQISSTLWLSVKDFNATTSDTFVSKCKFDAGVYSEPMALMNALWEYGKISDKGKTNWCFKKRMATKRWQQAVSSRNSLRKRAADFLGVNEQRIKLECPPKELPLAKLTILRLLKAWVFSESIIQCAASTLEHSSDGSVALAIKGSGTSRISEDLLSPILDKERHPYYISDSSVIEQTGAFLNEGVLVLPSFIEDFERRLLSYMSEMNLKGALCYSADAFYLYFEETTPTPSCEIVALVATMQEIAEETMRFAFQSSDANRRGIFERASGLWTIETTPESCRNTAEKRSFRRFHLTNTDQSFLTNCCRARAAFASCRFEASALWYFFSLGKTKKTKKDTTSQLFSVTLTGGCKPISKISINDILGRSVTSFSTKQASILQSVVFPRVPSNAKARHVLFSDVPEGARTLSILASSHRKQPHMLRLPQGQTDDTVDFAMKKEETDVSKRWKRFGSSNCKVFVDQDSVPASALCSGGTMYAVAANALELLGGSMKVEGLTLFPPNPLFLLLALKSFGLDPGGPMLKLQSDASHEASTDGAKSYAWLEERTTKKAVGDKEGLVLNSAALDESGVGPVVWTEDEVRKRIDAAALFDASCMDMGEPLMCFPEKIGKLINLFDRVDGASITPWETLEEEALTASNLKKWRYERRTTPQLEAPDRSDVVANEACSHDGNLPDSAVVNDGSNHQAPQISEIESKEPLIEKRSILKKTESKVLRLKRSIDEQQPLSAVLFAAVIQGENDNASVVPTTTLALVFQRYGEKTLGSSATNPSSEENQNRFQLCMVAENWKVRMFKGRKSGDTLYKARFANDAIQFRRSLDRGKNNKKLPQWIESGSHRPSKFKDAIQCVPPSTANLTIVESPHEGLLCETVGEALQMEAAFWLERKCFNPEAAEGLTHWYEQTIDQLIGRLIENGSGT